MLLATRHGSPSLGYSIVERRAKLKEEYLGLSGPQIVALKKAGTEITHTVSIPLMTYLGDTMAGDFLKLDHVKNSKVLITECTFFDPDHHDRARALANISISISSPVCLSAWITQQILLTHLSRRTDRRVARKAIAKYLGDTIAHRVHFLMDGSRRSPVAEQNADTIEPHGPVIIKPPGATGGPNLVDGLSAHAD